MLCADFGSQRIRPFNSVIIIQGFFGMFVSLNYRGCTGDECTFSENIIILTVIHNIHYLLMLSMSASMVIGDLEIGNHSFHSKVLNYSRHYLMMAHVGTINAPCVQIRHYIYFIIAAPQYNCATLHPCEKSPHKCPGELKANDCDPSCSGMMAPSSKPSTVFPLSINLK